MTTLDDPLVITGGPFGVGVDIARVFSKHMGSFPSSKAAALWDKPLPARRTVPSASRTLAVLSGDVTPCNLIVVPSAAKCSLRERKFNLWAAGATRIGYMSENAARVALEEIAGKSGK
jgi:hypothetical protein